MKTRRFIWTCGVLAAIVASMCCIGPASVSIIGVASFAGFSMFDTYRPYMIAASLIFVGVSFWLTYRRRTVDCGDGTCKVENIPLRDKIGTWGMSLFVIAAIAFPYQGSLPWSTPRGPNEDVSFVRVPLVCNAAPSIGCGSKAKFIMLELMNQPSVEEAWLNRSGTVLAVVWNTSSRDDVRKYTLRDVFSRHGVSMALLSGDEQKESEIEFKERGKWYKGSDVDALSVEEAGIIADRMIVSISKRVSFKKEKDKDALRDDIKSIIQRCFLSIKSFNELNDSAEQSVSKEIIAAGEKYLGKGNMPNMKVIRNECNLSGEHEDCCSIKKE